MSPCEESILKERAVAVSQHKQGVQRSNLCVGTFTFSLVFLFQVLVL